MTLPTDTAEPLSAAEREELVAEHRRYLGTLCKSDGDLWPCPTLRLLAERDRLAAALRGVVEEIKRWDQVPGPPDVSTVVDFMEHNRDTWAALSKDQEGAGE